MLISSKSKLENINFYGLFKSSFLPNYSNEYVQKDNIHEVMRPPTVRPSAATGSIWTGLPGKSF